MDTFKLKRINLLFLVLTWLGGICYIIWGGLAIKIPASTCFFVLGCINTFFALKQPRISRGYLWTMLAGLFLGLTADIALEFDFLSGAAVFGLGHICYLAAYCCLQPLARRDLIVSAALFLPCLGLILFLPMLNYGSVFMQAIVIVYALVICLMLGKALSNHLRIPDAVTKLLLIGSILFFFSDFMLLFAYFSDAGRITNILCLNTYYPGQAILACSIFRFAFQD